MCFFALLVDGCRVAAVKTDGTHPLLERALILEYLGWHLLIDIDKKLAELEVNGKQTEDAILVLTSAKTILVGLTGLGVDVESMEFPCVQTIAFNQSKLEGKLSYIERLICQIRKGRALLRQAHGLFVTAVQDLAGSA